MQFVCATRWGTKAGLAGRLKVLRDAFISKLNLRH
jgi:hypothetical protein